MMIRAKVIEVIEVLSDEGEGSYSNPLRTVRRYYDLDGRPLATDDPCDNRNLDDGQQSI